MDDRKALARAVIECPLEEARRLALADKLDEEGMHREAALQRVIAQPGVDGWRLAYADVIDPMGSDFALHADVIRLMVGRPHLFRGRPFNESWRHCLDPDASDAVRFVHQNLDLIAWADLDIRTEAVPGSYIWNRATGYGIDGEVVVSFSRGFVAEVQTDLDGFLIHASDLFRHPVERVSLAVRATYDDRFVKAAKRAGVVPTPWTWSVSHEERRRAVGRLFGYLPRVWYETEQDAEDGLNEACLTFGRRVADTRFLLDAAPAS